MKRLSFFFFAVCIGLARADNFKILSTHDGSFRDKDGEVVPISASGEKVWSISTGSITAEEPSGLRFKGWFTKLSGWTGSASAQDVDDDPYVATPQIRADQIFAAGKENNNLAVIVAKYVPLHTITTAVAPTGCGSVTLNPAGGTYEAGSQVTLKAEPTSETSDSGYHFVRWSDGATDATRKIDSLSANVSYTAEFTANGYNVSKSAQNAVITVATVGTYDQDLAISWVPEGFDGYAYEFVSAKILSGAQEVANFTSGTSATFNMKNRVGKYSSGITVEVKYTKTPVVTGYQLTINPNGGKFSGMTEPTTLNERLHYGAPDLNEVLTATDGQGYFMGYFTSGQGEMVYDENGHNVKGSYWTEDYPNGTFQGNQDLNLVARWGKANRVDAVAQPEAAGEVRGVGNYRDGTEAELTAVVTNAGYSFSCWTNTATGFSTNAATWKFVVTSDVAYAAIFTGNVYTVKFMAMQTSPKPMSGTPAEQTMQVAYGAEYGELPTAAYDDPLYALAGWYTGQNGTGTKIDSNTLVSVRDDDQVFYGYAAEKPTYTVEFNGNGATSGEMTDQTVLCDVPTRLAKNDFTRTGYTFAGWATEAKGAKVYDDQAEVTNLTAKDATATLYAVWQPITYWVKFAKHGGEGEMPDQPFAYDVEQGLAFNKFVNAGHDFKGWALSSKGDVVFSDGQPVSNLTADADGVVLLYAQWSSNAAPEYPDNELSLAADCAYNSGKRVALNLMTNLVEQTPNECLWEEGSDAGGNGQYVKIVPDPNIESKTVKMAVTLTGPGRLVFAYKVCINDYRPSSGDNNSFECSAKDFAAVYTPVNDWTDFEFLKNDSEEEQVIWSFVTRYSRGSDPADYALIDNIRWIPEGQGDEPIPVDVPVAVGGLVYDGWKQTGVAVGEGYTLVGNVATNAGDYEATATLEEGYVWGDGSADPTNIAWTIAKATHDMSGVTFASATYEYDGEEHAIAVAGVPSGVEVVYTGDATNRTEVGTNTVTASFKVLDEVNYGPIATQMVATLTIEKATVDMSGVTFASATYAWDGEEHSIAVAGVPSGVEVVYSGDPTNRTEVGTNTVTASFKVLDEVNYNAIATQMVATLTITAKEEPPPVPPVPPEPVVTNGVPVAVTGLVYDGTPKTGVPAGANYTTVGNVATNAGDYVATVTVTNGVWEGGTAGETNIAWTIAKAAYDMSGVTFASATYEYDGEEHSIAVAGVPSGVEVVYTGDAANRTEVGTNTVTANFKVLDADNYEAITTTLTAKLIITAKEEPPPEDAPLYEASQVGTFEPSVAATFNGWLYKDGQVVATILAKTTASRRAGAPIKSTVTVTPVGGKKKSYKTEVVERDGTFVDGFGIHYGNNALTGDVAGLPGVPDGAAVAAAKDFSKSKAEKWRMTEIPVGCRTLVLPTADGGYDCLSVTIDKKGKAKVKGTLDDGSAVSVTVQGALGAEVFAVPVAYSKLLTSKVTGERRQVTFGFLLRIDRASGAAQVSNETGGRWIGGDRFVSQTKAVVPPVDGSTHFICLETPVGYRVASDDGCRLTPQDEKVTISGKKWNVDKSVGTVKYDAAAGGVIVKVSKGKTPANVSKFKLSFTSKTGVVKGSFKLYYQPSPTKVKAETATVTGMTVDGKFYGNAVIKKKDRCAIWFE